MGLMCMFWGERVPNGEKLGTVCGFVFFQVRAKQATLKVCPKWKHLSG